MQTIRYITLLLCVIGSAVRAEPDSSEPGVLVAAASSVKLAMDTIVERFHERHPMIPVQVIYGSSGKISTQILNGAPFDVFFSADLSFPRSLVEEGLTASPVVAYAIGRLVLWQRGPVQPKLTDLADPRGGKLAIANPRHAPYGQRAREALTDRGLWDAVQSRLVFGENVAQAAQYAQSGAADFAIIALALALNPTLQAQGSYTLLDASGHQALEQGFVVTRHAAQNEAALKFSRFMASDEATAILQQYGFEVPQPQ